MRSFRKETLAMREMSEVIEKNPLMPRPLIDGGTSLGLSDELRQAELGFQFNIWRGTKESIEDQILLITEALGDLDWVINSPLGTNYAETYYVMQAMFHGAYVEICTHREAVCELVVIREDEVEEEIPDPELLEEATKDVPLVKVTTKHKITEWQCNQKLSEAVDPIMKALKEKKSSNV